MQENQADNLSRVVVLRLRRLLLLHLLFVAGFAIGHIAMWISLLFGDFKLGLAFYGLGVAFFFLAPPIVSFLYARSLNAWKAFWVATAAGIPFSLGGALVGIVLMTLGGRASAGDPGNQEYEMLSSLGFSVLLLCNIVAPLISYFLFRRRIVSIAKRAEA